MRRTSLPWRAGASAALVLALAGAAFAAPTRQPTWRSLHRPLHIPHIAPGTPCPTSKRDPRGDLSRFKGVAGTAWGRGPAYPVLQGQEGKPVLDFVYPPGENSGFFGSEWSGQKVMWVVNPAYHGRILIRGRQLDGPNGLRFDDGLVPPREKRVVGGVAAGWPSFTRLRAAGCYGYQIDGAHFSRVIVFEARAFTSG
jgi:hypothetical protein